MTIPQSRHIAAWPDDFVRRLRGWTVPDASRPGADTGPTPYDLHRFGLVDADGIVTRLGENVRYHLSEFAWQDDGLPLEGLVEAGALASVRSVLDVGCGAGQSLHHLRRFTGARMVGVDIDREALTLGARLARVAGEATTFSRTSAHRLPFADGTFDLVTSRIALNYMRQRDALAEMVRVLEPGGLLFLRVEGIWYDIGLLRSARGLRPLVCRSVDLAWGLVHATTGWQPTFGRWYRGGRAFGATNRLGAILAAHGCHVARSGPSVRSNRVFGRATQTLLLARKR